MFNTVGLNSQSFETISFDQAVTPIIPPAKNAFDQLNSYFSDFDSYDVHPFAVILISLASVLTIYTIARIIFKSQPKPQPQYILSETPWPYESIERYRYEKMVDKAKCTKNGEAIYELIRDDVEKELIEREGERVANGFNIFRATFAYTLQLESLFGTPEAVNNFLLDFKEKYPFSKYPIHDACLFVMPPDDAVWTVSLWRELIIKSGYHEDWMNMLPLAPAIENYLYRHLTNYRELEESGFTERRIGQRYRQQLKMLKQELKEIFPIEYSAFQAIQAKKASMKKTQKVSDEKFVDEAFVQFLIKSRTPSSFNLQFFYNIMRIVFYPQVPPQEEDLLLEFIRFGVPPKQYIEVQNLVQNSPKTHDAIPDITIKGESIDFPGYWLEKMVNNPLMGIAGGLTGCCQNIHGNGRVVVLHALSSPYGGIYRIMKGKDVWVAQSWAGITEAGELVFDSIEWNLAYNSKMIMMFFKALAEEIIRTNPSINRVLFGGGGNTPVKHKYPLQEKPYSPIKDYKDPYGLPGYDSGLLRFEIAKRSNKD